MVKTEESIALQTDLSTSSKPMPTSSCRKRKFKGVRMRSWGSWVSEIRAPNQKTRIWLGSYSTAEAAARAYDAALLCLKGSSANLNFPITSSSLPPAPPLIPDTIMSPKSIQRVAAAAAAAYSNEKNATTTTTTTTTATTTTTTTTPSTPPPPPPVPSTTSSQSSSSSNLIETDHDYYTPAMPSWSNYNTCGNEEYWMHPSPVDPWIDFEGLQSPKYTTEQMFNACAMFAPPTLEDFYEEEEGDIHLWSFC